MDTVFIQFYSRNPSESPIKWSYLNGKYEVWESTTLFIQNGFSHVWNICKQFGDFVWLYYELTGSIDEIYEANKNLKCPIKNVI